VVHKTYWLIIAFTLTACESPQPATPPQTDLHPFVGCWQSEDGLGIEGWTQDPSGWLFGYALNRDDEGDVKFFEQMRFDGEFLTVTGPNDDPTRFRQVKAGPEYIFENPDHDYPQRIRYMPSSGRLDAEISLLDGSKIVRFEKLPCDSSVK